MKNMNANLALSNNQKFKPFYLKVQYTKLNGGANFDNALLKYSSKSLQTQFKYKNLFSF